MFDMQVAAGEEIVAAIQDAIWEAERLSDQCRFDFNGITVIVAKDSDRELIRRDWQRGMNGCLGDKPTVGPYPNAKLTDAEKAADEEAMTAKEKRHAERQAVYAKKQAEQSAALKGALSVAGPLELSDEEGWQKCVDANKSAYGGRVVRYAEEWGRLMQTRIANGEAVADCADELSRLADDDGITGFMYGCAVQILAKCWKHGEELRKWHNSKYQVNGEGDKANANGGVINPAILTSR